MFKVTLEKKNYESAIRWWTRYEEALDKKSVMAAGVKFIGVGMQTNFDTEGRTAAGGWAELSLTTQRLRRRRGYPPEHPIMQQSGNLKKMTADRLAHWTLTQTSAVAYDGKGTGMGAGITKRSFKATVKGPKVENHYGGTVTMPSGMKARLPRRRFFGITQLAAEKASEAMMTKFMNEWARMSSKVVKY